MENPATVNNVRADFDGYECHGPMQPIRDWRVEPDDLIIGHLCQTCGVTRNALPSAHKDRRLADDTLYILAQLLFI
jgi:hypothetical protein